MPHMYGEGTKKPQPGTAGWGLSSLPPERGSMELDWDKYIAVAERFQGKVRGQDREDLKHSIILRLAEIAQRNGHKPLSEWAMIRVASYVVMEYWHAEKRSGKVISLNTEVEDGDGDRVELWQTLADDKAMDLEAWVDARTWLLGCPKRLVEIAYKRAIGMILDWKDYKYLQRYRKQLEFPI